MALAPALSVDSTLVQDRVVVTVRGELDVATSPLLRAALAELVEAAGVPCIVVDLAGVTFIDSAGVHALVEASKRLGGGGGELVLSGVKPGAFKVLDVCGLTSVFRSIDGWVRSEPGFP
jgi:anti-sigma B factor antagonist